LTFKGYFRVFYEEDTVCAKESTEVRVEISIHVCGVETIETKAESDVMTYLLPLTAAPETPEEGFHNVQLLDDGVDFFVVEGDREEATCIIDDYSMFTKYTASGGLETKYSGSFLFISDN
jgi:hypothetical protein